MRVALFVPCLTENFHPHTAISTVNILNFLGVKTEYVRNQTCCGLPAYNSGHIKEVIPLARHFINLFNKKDYVVAPSGSCVAMIRSFYQKLDLGQKEKSILHELNQKIFEITEFIVDVLHVTDLNGFFSHKITYHDSCILNRELGIKEQPRILLRSIRGVEFIEMAGSDECCGFGGTFSAKFSQLSISILKKKCENIRKTGAEFCVGADSSCLMNIGGYLAKNNMGIKILHIMDLLAGSMGLSSEERL